MLRIDFDYVEGLAELYAESSDCEFIGNKEGTLTVEQAREKLNGYITTKKYGAFERIGIMKIYHQGELVGFSLPRKIDPKEYPVFKVDEAFEGLYYRIGTVYIGKAHRGKGIMTDTIQAFQNMYKNVIWTCNSRNIASHKSAIKGGLKFSHQIFVGENKEWKFHNHDGVIRIDNVYKTEVNTNG